MANIDFTDRKTFLKFAPGNRPRRKIRPGKASLVAVLVAGALIPVFFVAARAGQAGFAAESSLRKTQAERAAEYNVNLERLARERARLSAKWAAASGARERRETLEEAAAVLFSAVENDLIPCWYGTGYDFNGATDTPGVGGISCGHFVTTVLRDAGLRLDRLALARLPSETLIRSLVPETSIRRYSLLSGEEFLKSLKTLAPGLYVLGLDKHVGFLSLTPAGPSFIHSTLLPPYSVVREPAASSRALMTSDYRVLGNLSADRRFLEKWLAGEKIQTKR